MPYKIKRSAKIFDTLELCDEAGLVERKLTVEIDVDSIAAELRKRLDSVRSAEKQLKAAENDKDYSAAYDIYKATVEDVLIICFGAENERVLSDYFEGNAVEMSLSVVPYIYEKILPEVNAVISKRREQIKYLYKSKPRIRK